MLSLHRLFTYFSPYSSRIALKSRCGKMIEDPNRLEESADSEKTSWQMISDDLYGIQCKPKGPERDKERLSVIHRLERNLRDDFQDARAEMQLIDRRSKRFNTDDFEDLKHYHRRNIAGHYQVIDLLKQGDEAFKTAMLDRVIILEGHRYALWADFLVHRASD